MEQKNEVLSDQRIAQLIAMEKKIVKRPPKLFVERQGSRHMNFTLSDEGEKLDFSVFVRQNMRLTSNFSIGLMQGEYTLLRCNGFHGTTRSGYYSAEHHAYPHMHILSEADIRGGRTREPSTHEDMSGAYHSFESAIIYFCRKCAIIGYEDYFTAHEQISISESILNWGAAERGSDHD